MEIEIPSVKEWGLSRKRKTWFESLNDEKLGLFIGIEIVSYNIELLDTAEPLMQDALKTVYDQALNPKRFRAREYFKSVSRQSLNLVDHDIRWAFLDLIKSIIKGADVADRLQEAVGRSRQAISCEDQIEVIRIILLAHKQFGLPAPLDELGICNDWLEERGEPRLRIESILRG